MLLKSLFFLGAVVFILSQAQAVLGADGQTMWNQRQFWVGHGDMKSLTIPVNGTSRQLYLYRPANYPQNQALPTLFVFHGKGGRALGMDTHCCGGITSAADRNGFVIVFLDGIDHGWFDGRPANADIVRDDLGFVSKVIDMLVTDGTADRQHIYAAGISNGGYFTQYLALNMPEKFAAVASVAASLAPEHRVLMQGKPVPIEFFLGTKDPLVPWAGGRLGANIKKDFGKTLCADDSIAGWLTNNHELSPAQEIKLPDADPSDGTSVTEFIYGNPSSRSQVVLYKIEGGGHTWPGGEQYYPAAFIGRVCRHINANEEMMRFFKQHSLAQTE